ncbi:MAG: Flp pilus assembly protein CpaB [Micavibrio aeruginosavorus]|uniref:Flp pilus assembly protein CpaB n=1 Tax=Micavibrio aeruginosavorus TaxID=349221 RepID=A0A2W5PSN4_9BACT|nr:MAG: Flp pilus assembly protein CpaB [Micavibrio aeruginosavorus]
MNKNVLIVLAGGFVVAILVAVLVQASLGGKKVEDTGPKTMVLVAAKDLPLGAELKEGDLKWQAWPGQAFSGAIVRKADADKANEALKGRLIQKVSAGQPVLGSYTFKEGRGNVVAATLEKGQRAVAIPVKADTMAGGFISPGDFVDVIMTYKVSLDRDDTEASAFVNNHSSETILKNVRVLAVDQEASRNEDKAKIARTVTLAVDSKGAEKVALASEMGDLTLSLRGLGDDDDSNTASMTTDMEVSKTMQNIARIRNGGGGGGPVRIYNGASVQEVRPRGGNGGVIGENTQGSGGTEEGVQQ